MNKYKVVLLIVALSVHSLCSLAQPGGGGPPGGGAPVPITGIEILLALGGLLGIKRMLTTRKKHS